MTFFEKSKALKEAATKTPWKKHDSTETRFSYIESKDHRTVAGYHITDGDSAYIVHCVNTHARLCELLEEAMDALDIAYTEHYRFDVKIEIQAVLDEMGKG